jgi:ABC-type Zn uptake system ZnuABC Zn-binding protein ZnuA
MLRGLGRSLLAFGLGLTTAAFAQQPLRVVTTTTDLRSLTEAVGGDRVSVMHLVPPELDPEEFQPKPQHAALVREAQLVVRVGADFDLWFDRLLARVAWAEPDLQRLRRGQSAHVDASYGIALLDIRGAQVGPADGHAHGSGNPHYWLDPKNAEIMTGNILEALARVDPANEKVYDANRQAVLAKLEMRLPAWSAQLEALRGRPLVAYHSTWAYFARRFRLNFVAFIEPKPGVPPSPAHLADVRRVMRAKDVRIVVRQPHEPERDARFLATDAGATIAVLAGSVGALPATQDYFALFDTNIAALLAADRR